MSCLGPPERDADGFLGICRGTRVWEGQGVSWSFLALCACVLALWMLFCGALGGGWSLGRRVEAVLSRFQAHAGVS